MIGPRLNGVLSRTQALKFDDVIGQIGKPIAAFSEPRFYSPMQHFPERGNADHSRNVTVFDGV